MNIADYTDRRKVVACRDAIYGNIADTPCVFEASAQARLGEREQLIVSGTYRVVQAIKHFDNIALFQSVYGHNALGYDQPAVDWLKENPKFSGDVYIYPEGTKAYPGSPIVQVVGPYGQAVLLGTVITSILNFSCAVATTASGIRGVAGPDLELIDTASEYTNIGSSCDLALAAYVGGFDATTNVAAKHKYNIPCVGETHFSLHVLLDDAEKVFRLQRDTQGCDTTFTVGSKESLETLIKICAEIGETPKAIAGQYCDSHRATLNNNGCEETKIYIGNTEDNIAFLRALESSLFDGAFIGSSLVAGNGAPIPKISYNLVEVDGTSRSPYERRMPILLEDGTEEIISYHNAIATPDLVKGEVRFEAAILNGTPEREYFRAENNQTTPPSAIQAGHQRNR